MIREYEIIFFTNEKKKRKAKQNEEKTQIYFLTNCKEKQKTYYEK